jgi:hypothetical protein
MNKFLVFPIGLEYSFDYAIVQLRNNVMDATDCHKLTKKYFWSLPPGVYIVSNCYSSVGPGKSTPVFYEYVEQPDKRKVQWERIKTAGADQRFCDVYQSSEEFKRAIEFKTAVCKKYPGIIICEVDTEKVL